MKIDLRSVATEEPRREAGIDWLTAVIHLNEDGALSNSSMVPLLMERIRHAAPHTATVAFTDGELPTAYGGRRPYALAISPAQSVVIMWHPDRTEVVIELAGHAMANARSRGLEFAVLAELAPYVSRMDIAVDTYTEVTPSEFVAAGHAKRIKSIGTFKSPEGETVYVGSRSSEAFARVYRYSPPHIRSDRLRVETVFRRSVAKQIAQAVVRANSLTPAIHTNTARFGWLHQLWVRDRDEQVELHRLVSTPSVDGKLRWLEKQVIPTIRALVRDGVIDESRLLEMVFGPR